MAQRALPAWQRALLALSALLLLAAVVPWPAGLEHAVAALARARGRGGGGGGRGSRLCPAGYSSSDGGRELPAHHPPVAGLERAGAEKSEARTDDDPDVCEL